MGKRKGRKIDGKRRKVGLADPFKWPHFSFFKIMVGSFRDTLKIPPELSRSWGNLLGRIVHLEDADGASWETKVCEMNDRLQFRQGWEKFVFEHSIMPGEFLIFNYDGNSSFGVKIFGRCGCERRIFCEKRSDKRKKSASGSSSISLRNAGKSNSSDDSLVIISGDDDEEGEIGRDRILMPNFDHIQNEENSPQKKRLKSAEEDDEPEIMIMAKNGDDTQMHENGHSEAPGENHSLTVDCTESVKFGDHDKNPSMTVNHVEVNEVGQHKQDELIIDYGKSCNPPVDQTEGTNEADQSQREKQDESTFDDGQLTLPRHITILGALDKNPSMIVDHVNVDEAGQRQPVKKDKPILDHIDCTLPNLMSNLEALGKSCNPLVDQTEGVNEAGQSQLEKQDEPTFDDGQHTLPRLISNLGALDKNPSMTVDNVDVNEAGQRMQVKQDAPNLEALGNSPNPPIDHKEGVNEAGQPQQEKQDESTFDDGKSPPKTVALTEDALDDQGQQDKQDQSTVDYGQHALQFPFSNSEDPGIGEPGQRHQEKRDESTLDNGESPSKTVDLTEGGNEAGQPLESTLDYGQCTIPPSISNLETMGKNPSATIDHTEGGNEASESALDFCEQVHPYLISNLEDLGENHSLPIDCTKGVNEAGQHQRDKHDELLFELFFVNETGQEKQEKEKSTLDYGQSSLPCFISSSEALDESPSATVDHAEEIIKSGQPEKEKQEDSISDNEQWTRGDNII